MYLSTTEWTAHWESALTPTLQFSLGHYRSYNYIMVFDPIKWNISTNRNIFASFLLTFDSIFRFLGHLFQLPWSYMQTSHRITPYISAISCVDMFPYQFLNKVATFQTLSFVHLFDANIHLLYTWVSLCMSNIQLNFGNIHGYLIHVHCTWWLTASNIKCSQIVISRS